MCIIIDANRAHAVFCEKPQEDYEPIWRWLWSRSRDHGVIVYGQKLTRELLRAGIGSHLLSELAAAGRAVRVADAEIDAAQAALQGKALRSDDPHVLALALASGARVLCTADDALIADFGNGDLIASPRGKVYRRADHAGLLKHSKSCRKTKGA